jgi:putative flippase GtrA
MRLVKFLVVGGIGVLINIGLLALFTEIFGFHYMFSAIVVALIVVTYNYFANNYWSFYDRKNMDMKTGYKRFAIVMIAYSVIYYVSLYLFTELFFRDFSFYFVKGYMISAVFSIIVATIPKYTICYFWVWKSYE